MKALLAGIFFLLFGGQSAVPAAVNFFSPAQDLEIGQDSAEKAEKQLAIIHDPHLNAYLRAMGLRLQTSLLSRQQHYQFDIVNSDDLSSLGFPNGAVYVSIGLLNLASNDDEVAAILAHEIGHISSRHPTSQLSRQLLVMAPISLSAGLTSSDGWKEHLTKLGIVFGANAAFLHYSPDQEREAVEVAVKWLTSARFDPNALHTVIGKINDAKKKHDVPLPAFLYNHPFSDVREPESDAAARVRTSIEFRRFHAALERAVKAAIADEKTVEPSVANDLVPNLFTHDYYQLNYPEGWQVSRTGTNSAIIAPADGILTSTIRDDVTHGVILDILDLSQAEKPMTLDQATARVMIYLRQSNAGPGTGLRLVLNRLGFPSALLPADQTLRAVPGAQTPMWIHGEPALRTVLLGKSQATGASELVWLVTRMYYQNVFYIVLVAPEEEFSELQPLFEQIIGSVPLR